MLIGFQLKIWDPLHKITILFQPIQVLFVPITTLQQLHYWKYHNIDTSSLRNEVSRLLQSFYDTVCHIIAVRTHKILSITSI